MSHVLRRTISCSGHTCTHVYTVLRLYISVTTLLVGTPFQVGAACHMYLYNYGNKLKHVKYF